MARPTKLTEQVSDHVIQAVRAGNYAEAACRSAGISASTFYRWLERGQQESSGIYRDFHDEIRTAEAEAEVHAVAIVRLAMNDDWRAAIAYLDRRYPGRWRRHQTTELTGPDGGPIRTADEAPPELSRLSNDELDQLEELLARATKPE